MFRILNFILFCICFYIPLTAQFLANSEIGVHIGITQSGTDTHSWGYNGESLFSEANVLYGASYKIKINNSFTSSLTYSKSKINGDDKNIASLQSRGWKFSSPLSEFSLNFHWNILSMSRGKSKKIFNAEGKKIKFSQAEIYSQQYFSHIGNPLDPIGFKTKKPLLHPYLLLGISSTNVAPEVDYRNTPPRQDLLESDIDKQKNQYFHLSLGAGINLFISDRLSIDAELKGVIPQTDLLDGISRTILEFNSERNKDSYQFALIRINYSLAAVKNCDNDQIEDKYDKCPCIAGPINLWGCPDTDLDGIPDINDECPLEKGTNDLKGCPDTDLDGIPDIIDECPQTFGLYLFDGCPDRDADGIPDKNDECPDIPGSKTNNGCPY